MAVAAEMDVDDIRWGEQQRVRPAAVPIADDRHERRVVVVGHRDQGGDRLGTDARKVDRQDQDGIGAAGHGLVPGFAQAVVEAAAALAEWPRPGPERQVAHLIVGRDHECLGDTGRRDGGADRAVGHPQHEVAPLFRV